MDDYHKRIEVISHLKDNLAYLNDTIHNSQEQRPDFQTITDKFEEKIKRKEV